MMATVERLCSDEFRGRRAGSPEHARAADYIASHFHRSSLSALTVADFDDYKQRLTMRYALVRSKDDIKAVLSYNVPGKNGVVSRIRSLAYPGFKGRGGLDLKSEVVFVGHGISDPASGWDDYAGLDVSGKIVLWLAGKPQGVTVSAATTAHKMAAAYEHGAAACLIYKPNGGEDKWGTNVGLAGSIADFPCLAIDRAIASEILTPGGFGPDGSPTNGLTVGARGAGVRLRITLVCDPQRATCNVIGVLPGIDPEVGHEVVILGAHFDHLGDNAKGQIFRGADDNASGTAVVLEAARIISQMEIGPRRTILFAAWTGEEAGLVGSNHFAANPPFPLENIVSNIELDMVGAGIPGTFMTTGASSYPAHYQHLASAAADQGITLKSDSMLGASDHLAFTRKGVPTSLIYSAGDHPNFHTVRDTPSALNPNVLESAARLAALSTWRAANH
jgi:hypothetical protein